MTDPYAIVAAGLALWVVVLTVALALVVRHLHKVEDLGAATDEDLAEVERKVEKLKVELTRVRQQPLPATTLAMPVVRTFPEPTLGAQARGRHARVD